MSETEQETEKEKEKEKEELLVWLFQEFYDLHVGDLHNIHFEETMKEAVRDLAAVQLEGEECDDAALDQAFCTFSLLRPCRTSLVLQSRQHNFEGVLDLLRLQPKCDQRSAEWYETRHNLMTASSLYKVFGTESEQNSFIVEKCAPEKPRPPLAIHDPRHWGVRYEPVSIQYYTAVNHTVVEEFGCLVHPKYPFLGASPDGINVDRESEVYGRMLEIKNPVSRVITGSPTKEYWIQMQMQMEVCSIDACDFLETKFAEYADVEAFRLDGSFHESADGKPKGIILLFLQEGKYVYEYGRFGAEEEESELWQAETKEVEGREFLQTIYWKLDEISCVLVERNEAWFQSRVEEITQFWGKICDERSTGAWSNRIVKKVSVW